MKKCLQILTMFFLGTFHVINADSVSIDHSMAHPMGAGVDSKIPVKIRRETIKKFYNAIRTDDAEGVRAAIKEKPSLTLFRFNLGEKIGNGLTPLAVAAIYGSINVIKEIFSIGTDAQQLISNDISEDTRGNSPFKLAVMHNRSMAVLKLLIEKGSDVNSLNNQRETPLMYAAEHGYIEIVRLLLELPQIDVLQTNKNGKSALQLAAQNDHQKIVDMLHESEDTVDSLMDVLVEYITHQLNA